MINRHLLAFSAIFSVLGMMADAREITWFGDWQPALAEARRSHRPIMLVSGAPHCKQVPGMW